MTPDISGPDRRRPTKTGGRHRAPHRKQTIVVRTIGVGAVAGCVALVAEMNAPDADALSILIPMGNGNATQVNILEGNKFDPQFGLGGNVSNNTTVGNIMLGNNPGNADVVIPLALGGAAGTGNVTQVNILSYNIFNPQVSLFGNNVSNNLTVSNVAAANGNGVATTTGTPGLFGWDWDGSGSGNTTQVSFLSGNIYNPQLSLFGSNTSNNIAVTNLATGNGNGSPTGSSSGLFGLAGLGMNGSGNSTQVAAGTTNIVNPQASLFGSNSSNNLALTNGSFFNGNGSPTSTSGGGLLGGLLIGQTGSGNSNQVAGGVSNIENTQLALAGFNFSNNYAGSNNQDSNGNGSGNDASSPNGGNNTILGQFGSGNANQFGNGNGNIDNNQFRFLPNPNQAPPVTTPQAPQTPIIAPTDVPGLTNQQVSSSQSTGSGTTGNDNGVLLYPNGQSGGPSGPDALGQKVADAVKGAADAVKNALTPKKASTSDNSGGG
jgi:hypothetical protein